MKQYSSRIDNGTLPWPGVLGSVQALAQQWAKPTYGGTLGTSVLKASFVCTYITIPEELEELRSAVSLSEVREWCPKTSQNH